MTLGCDKECIKIGKVGRRTRLPRLDETSYYCAECLRNPDQRPTRAYFFDTVGGQSRLAQPAEDVIIRFEEIFLAGGCGPLRV